MTKRAVGLPVAATMWDADDKQADDKQAKTKSVRGWLAVGFLGLILVMVLAAVAVEFGWATLLAVVSYVVLVGGAVCAISELVTNGPPWRQQ